MGLTTAFLRGLGFFSPPGITSRSLIYSLSVTERRLGFRFRHHLTVQPVISITLELLEQDPQEHRYQDPILRSDCRLASLLVPFGCFRMDSRHLSHQPCFFWFTSGGGFPPGCCPLLFYLLPRRSFFIADPLFGVYARGGIFLRVARWSPVCPSYGCSSFEAFRSSLSSRITSRQRCALAVAFLTLIRSPSRSSPPASLSGFGFLDRSSFPWFTKRRSVLRCSVADQLSFLFLFLGADLFG